MAFQSQTCVLVQLDNYFPTCSCHCLGALRGFGICSKAILLQSKGIDRCLNFTTDHLCRGWWSLIFALQLNNFRIGPHTAKPKKLFIFMDCAGYSVGQFVCHPVLRQCSTRILQCSTRIPQCSTRIPQCSMTLSIHFYGTLSLRSIQES